MTFFPPGNRSKPGERHSYIPQARDKGKERAESRERNKKNFPLPVGRAELHPPSHFVRASFSALSRESFNLEYVRDYQSKLNFFPRSSN